MTPFLRKGANRSGGRRRLARHHARKTRPLVSEPRPPREMLPDAREHRRALKCVASHSSQSGIGSWERKVTKCYAAASAHKSCQGSLHFPSERSINHCKRDLLAPHETRALIGCWSFFHFHPLSPTRCDSRGAETGVVSGRIRMERLDVSRCPRMPASEAQRGPCGHASCSNDARHLNGCLPQKRWSLETLQTGLVYSRGGDGTGRLRGAGIRWPHLHV